MPTVFYKLLDMSASAAVIVVAVLILRPFLKKVPKFISCALWALVGIRLVCPFSIKSAVSLVPKVSVTNNVSFSAASEAEPITGGTVQNVVPTVETSENAILTVLAVAWLCGVAFMLTYMLISYICLRVRVREAAFLHDNIYECDSIRTPFILGVFCPKIYLPSSINQADAELVIAHERAHLRRLDHVWKPLGFVILTLHWFNPLIWLAYVLLCRDIELACDEKVIKQLGADVKKPYSEALVNCSVPRRAIAACPLAFGEVGVKTRIKNVLNYKKPAFWIIIVSLVLLAAVAVCFLTDPLTPARLDEYISQVIIEQNSEHIQPGYTAFEAHTVFGTRRRGNEIKAYTMVYYTEYTLDGAGELDDKVNGSHIPTVITVKYVNGEYELIGYDQPRDGTYYSKDIKKLFPWYLRYKTNTQLYIKQHRVAFEMHAGVDLDKYYAGLYDKIAVENKEQTAHQKQYVSYIYRHSPDPLTPSITLCDEDKTFSFMYSGFSSYLCHGEYEITSEGLTLNTDDGKFTYFFEAVDDGWRFVAGKSSVIPSYRYSGDATELQCPVPDGAVFEHYREQQ